MEFDSYRDYWRFYNHVVRERRFIWSEETEKFLNNMAISSKNRIVPVSKGKLLWRAQLGHDWRWEGEEDARFEVPCAYHSARMKPLRDRAFDGRANAKGIPTLYLSTKRETAISEVRPWIGSFVSVGQFKIIRDIHLVDCSMHKKEFTFYFEEPPPKERLEVVWSDIDRAFSEPMTRVDDKADYTATQILAELFKKIGYDGIAYRSNFGNTGYNIAIFDLEAADLISCQLHQITKISIESSETDNPHYVDRGNR